MTKSDLKLKLQVSFSKKKLSSTDSQLDSIASMLSKKYFWTSQDVVDVQKYVFGSFDQDIVSAIWDCRYKPSYL